MDTMNICIIGGGAMGCALGGMLADHGHTAVIVDTDQTVVNAIAAHGVTLEDEAGASRTVPVAAASGYAPARDADLVLVLVKAFATRNAAEALRPFLNPRALVLSLQNGLGNLEALESVLPPGQIAVGVTGIGATALGPGRTRLSGIGRTHIGARDPRVQAALDRVARVLTGAGIPTEVDPDILARVWTKLLANAGINALAALTGLKNGDIARNPEGLDLAGKAAAETARVARALGIDIQVGDPVAVVRDIALRTATNDASMLQDVRHGRRTEIEAINGEIARLGEAAGVEVPVNEILAALVRLREQGSAT